MPTCPWRARERPIVADVFELYGAREMTDPIALAGGPDAPNVVVEALKYLDRCLASIRAYEREREEERRRTDPKRKR